MMQTKTLAILVLTALLAIPAGAQDSTGKAKDKKEVPAMASATSTRAATPPPTSATNDPDYEIGPGDTLNISVWKEAELSGIILVRPDGKVSLPLAGDVQAAGATPTKLAATITERLRQYLTDPRVTVIVTLANSRRIYLIGEVVRPGAIPMLPNMTLLQALSTSGGFSQFANVKKMYVLRVENGKQIKMPVNYKAAISGRAPEQNIALKAGDTIVVP
jgi:polysaccharide export outer membrane protein